MIAILPTWPTTRVATQKPVINNMLVTLAITQPEPFPLIGAGDTSPRPATEKNPEAEKFKNEANDLFNSESLSNYCRFHLIPIPVPSHRKGLRAEHRPVHEGDRAGRPECRVLR